MNNNIIYRMLKAYKYRIYPNEEQSQKLIQFFGAARFVYNWGLEKKIKAYQEGEREISFFTLANLLTKLKRQEEFSWLQGIQAQSIQMALRNLDNAFTNFFKKRADFPKFKSRHKSKNSCQFPQFVKVDFEKHLVQVPKIGKVKFAKNRSFEGQVKTCTVSMTKTGKFYISVLVEDGKESPQKLKALKSKALGIDLGLKDFITTSKGEKVANPKFLQKKERLLAKRQREFSKKQKGSKNREKARLKLAKTYEKVTNQRNDFLHKLTNNLVKDSQITTFCIEDLNISGMMKNHCLAGAIGSASWSKFLQYLQYKADSCGKNVVQIGRFEASSKTCLCGVKNEKLTLKERSWTCGSCGKTHDRDILAANNIKTFALIKIRATKLGAEDCVPSINKACGAMGVSPSNEARTPKSSD